MPDNRQRANFQGRSAALLRWDDKKHWRLVSNYRRHRQLQASTNFDSSSDPLLSYCESPAPPSITLKGRVGRRNGWSSCRPNRVRIADLTPLLACPRRDIASLLGKKRAQIQCAGQQGLAAEIWVDQSPALNLRRDLAKEGLLKLIHSGIVVAYVITTMAFHSAVVMTVRGGRATVVG
ncbi:hypothetical protein B7463_g12177, partial [Scytalidium lignicola]